MTDHTNPDTDLLSNGLGIPHSEWVDPLLFILDDERFIKSEKHCAPELTTKWLREVGHALKADELQPIPQEFGYLFPQELYDSNGQRRLSARVPVRADSELSPDQLKKREYQRAYRAKKRAEKLSEQPTVKRVNKISKQVLDLRKQRLEDQGLDTESDPILNQLLNTEPNTKPKIESGNYFRTLSTKQAMK